MSAMVVSKAGGGGQMSGHVPRRRGVRAGMHDDGPATIAFARCRLRWLASAWRLLHIAVDVCTLHDDGIIAAPLTNVSERMMKHILTPLR